MSSCCAQPSSLKATRHSGGVGAGIVTALVERRFAGQIARVSGVDTYVPLGDAANAALVSEDDIERGIRRGAVVVSSRAGCPAARAARGRARR
jgi:3-oxoacyl-[acyl-carrier-protein] synthase III